MMQVRTLSVGLAVAATALAPRGACADVFVQTYLGPRVEAASAPAMAGSGLSLLGIETFNNRPVTGNKGGAGFTTDFGTGGVFTGAYSGTFGIHAADQYGGAGGAGGYIVTFDHGGGYTLKLGHDASVPGVNYFGMELSALDGGNLLDFYREGALVYSYAPAALIGALGACPGDYCGNPSNPSQNAGEQYAFVNFFDRTGTFDQITFHEGAGYGGGYESDNHTVGYRTQSAVFGNQVAVAEPAALGVLGAGLAGLAVFRLCRWRRDLPRPGR